MAFAPVAGLPPGQEEKMQPSESTVVGAASEEPRSVSMEKFRSIRAVMSYLYRIDSQLDHSAPLDVQQRSRR